MNRFFLAVLLGYLAGIVSAPKKGSELREEIKEKLLDLQQMGTDMAEAVQRRGQILVDTATPVVEQVQIEGKMLQQESDEIAQNATQLFNESCERGAAALEQAEQRIKEKATPAISLVKDDANYLKNQGAQLLKKASAAFADLKEDSLNVDPETDGTSKIVLKDASNL